jgi:two-component sensor histidine kinase
MTETPWRRPLAWIEARPVTTLTVLVLLATAVRAGLAPLLGDKQVWSIYFPVVVLASYVFGARRAAVATLACGLLGYGLFSGAHTGLEGAVDAAPGLFLFLMNCAAVLYVVGALNGALKGLATQQGESEAMAQAHAELFHEVNQRITHHLRLVAGVLALQAKGEPEPTVSAGLKRAAERSLQISRAHAELSGQTFEPVRFGPIAERIVATLLEARGEAPDRVPVIVDADLGLSQDAATALAAALLECLDSLLNGHPAGAITVRLAQDARGRRVELAVAEARAAQQLGSLADGYLLRAVVEQLGADLRFRRDGRGGVVELAFEPAARPLAAAAAPAEQTLH